MPRLVLGRAGRVAREPADGPAAASPTRSTRAAGGGRASRGCCASSGPKAADERLHVEAPGQPRRGVLDEVGDLVGEVRGAVLLPIDQPAHLAVPQNVVEIAVAERDHPVDGHGAGSRPASHATAHGPSRLATRSGSTAGGEVVVLGQAARSRWRRIDHGPLARSASPSGTGTANSRRSAVDERRPAAPALRSPAKRLPGHPRHHDDRATVVVLTIDRAPAPGRAPGGASSSRRCPLPLRLALVPRDVALADEVPGERDVVAVHHGGHASQGADRCSAG